ncbi:MAG: hypothetical protein WCH34_02470 [Bacteroidota bacterium]
MNKFGLKKVSAIWHGQELNVFIIEEKLMFRKSSVIDSVFGEL